MTANDAFDRDLRTWLEATASTSAPAGLHDTLIDHVRGSRQRPRWLVGVRGGTVGAASGAREGFGVGAAYLLVVLAVVLAVVAAAVVAGAFRSDPIRSIRNGAIAYSVRELSHRGQPYSIHVVDAAGKDRVIGFASCPAFSRDGSALTYLTDSHSNTVVHVARPDGSLERAALAIGEEEYALSPDATMIAWINDPPTGSAAGGRDGNELWVAPVAGGPGARIVPVALDRDVRYSSPVWSPDGRQIAFAGSVAVSSLDEAGEYRAEIDVVDADGANRRVFTRPGTTEIGLSWSPSGRFLAYLGLPDGAPIPSIGAPGGIDESFNQPQDVFVTDLDGSEDLDLTNTAAAERNPAWSPDGAHLAYEEIGVDGVGHLTTVRMDGATPAGPPMQGPASEFTWSPDGTALLVVDGLVGDPLVDPQPGPLTIQAVDADFAKPPVTLARVDEGLVCVPTWQRLEP